jgi:hypothetical protein
MTKESNQTDDSEDDSTVTYHPVFFTLACFRLNIQRKIDGEMRKLLKLQSFREFPFE